MLSLNKIVSAIFPGRFAAPPRRNDPVNINGDSRELFYFPAGLIYPAARAGIDSWGISIQ